MVNSKPIDRHLESPESADSRDMNVIRCTAFDNMTIAEMQLHDPLCCTRINDPNLFCTFLGTYASEERELAKSLRPLLDPECGEICSGTDQEAQCETCGLQGAVEL